MARRIAVVCIHTSKELRREVNYQVFTSNIVIRLPGMVVWRKISDEVLAAWGFRVIYNQSSAGGNFYGYPAQFTLAGGTFFFLMTFIVSILFPFSFVYVQCFVTKCEGGIINNCRRRGVQIFGTTFHVRFSGTKLDIMKAIGDNYVASK